MKVYDNRPKPAACEVRDVSPGMCLDYSGSIYLRSNLNIEHVTVVNVVTGEALHLRPYTRVEPLSTARIVIGGPCEFVIGEPEDEEI